MINYCPSIQPFASVLKCGWYETVKDIQEILYV